MLLGLLLGALLVDAVSRTWCGFDCVTRWPSCFLGAPQGTNRRSIPEDDPELETLLDADLWEQVQEEIELLDEVRPIIVLLLSYNSLVGSAESQRMDIRTIPLC